MKKILALFLLLTLGLCSCNIPSSSTTTGQSNDVPPESNKEDGPVKKAVLLLGQSNMAGRGFVDSVEKIDDDRIYMMRDLEWIKMEEPIFTDKDTAGTGPASAFAKAYVETYNENLGLIPAAFGGSSLADWAVGGELYNNAIEMSKEALRTADIVAILWHQGESDTTNNSYSYQLKDIINALYEELELDVNKVPFIAGELFEQGSADENKDFVCWPDTVNKHLKSLDDDFPLYALVSGKGFRHIGDKAHLDGPSTRVLGYRYFTAYYEIVEGKTCPYDYSENLDDYLLAPPNSNDNSSTDEVYLKNFSLEAGQYKEFIIDLSSVDTSSPIVITFNSAQNTAVPGPVDDALLSINNSRVIRISNGKATHIFDEAAKNAIDSSSWWGYQGTDFPNTKIQFKLTVDIDSKTVTADFGWNISEPNRSNIVLDSIDFSGNKLIIKFGGRNTPAIEISNFNIDYTKISN